MKKFLLTLSILLGLAIPSFAQRANCNRVGANAVMCDGLVAYYAMEEASDSARLDSYGYADLQECPGINIANAVDTGFGNAASFAGGTGSRLFLPYGAAMFGQEFTIAARIYPTSYAGSGVARTIVSTQGTTGIGFYFDVRYAGASLQYLRATVFTEDTDTSVYAQINTNVTINAWHKVAMTVTPVTTAYMRVRISLDGSAFTDTVLNYANHTLNFADFIVGSETGDCSAATNYPFIGRIDEVAIYGRAWSMVDVGKWNAGAKFPF